MKNLLKELYNHKIMSKEESKAALISLTDGSANSSQISSFLTVFLMRDITSEELDGFREAMIELSLDVDIDGNELIDLCGTGGDGKDTFNISTISSFVVAGAGIKVAKHGNYGVSSSCGSSNIISHLGHEFSNDVSSLKYSLDKSNICFLHAPLFHPSLKNISPIRSELGVKTFFNMLGPMVNPIQPKSQLVGVFNSNILFYTLRLYHSILILSMFFGIFISIKNSVNYEIVLILIFIIFYWTGIHAIIISVPRHLLPLYQLVMVFEVPSSGAVEGSRTPTSKWTLDPEPSASTNSATTAFGGV